jgi:hypothetical protein
MSDEELFQIAARAGIYMAHGGKKKSKTKRREPAQLSVELGMA